MHADKWTENEDAIIDFEAVRASMMPYTVLLPEEYIRDEYEGTLYGYYIDNTRTYNVVTDETVNVRNDVMRLGTAVRCNEPVPVSADNEGLLLKWADHEAQVTIAGDPDASVIVDHYSLVKDVFSRNQGILESSRMAGKQAVIAGIGSGGFFIGLELVKAGIGSIIVADDDILAYHNICRHVGGIHDVGKYKTDIFRERAADINPACKVYAFRELLQHVDPGQLKDIIWKDSVLMCCTDNRHAGYVCNELADQYHIPMVEAGCGVRASTGEIFYYRPDCGMPCYTCAFGEDAGVDHSGQGVRRRFYATEAELEKVHFQPGMSMDIESTAIFAAKLGIDLLMEREEGYEAKLLPYIGQVTVLLNYPVGSEINPYMKLFEHEEKGLLPMIWKTGSVRRNASCVHCGAA